MIIAFYRFIILLFWLSLYQVNFLESRVENYLIKSVKTNGAFVIKLAQWYAARVVDSPFSKEVFENNNIHEFRHTKKIIEREQLDIEIYECIASGSIGQVYKGKYKGHNVAIKVRHPHVLHELQIPETFIRFLTYLAALFGKRFICVNDYINMNEFLDKFRTQIDFTNECTTIEHMRKNLQNCEKIVIPKVMFCETDILVMEFHDGKHLQEITSFSERYNLCMLLMCFMRYTFLHLGIVHADLHPGNYRFQDGKLILYDFGLIAKADKDLLKPFLHYYQTAKFDSMFEYMIRGCLRTPCSEDVVKNMLNDDSFMKCFIKPPNMIRLLNESTLFLKKYNKQFDTDFVTFILAYALVEKTFNEFGFHRGPPNAQQSVKVYHDALVQQLSFMRQHNIFPEMQKENEKVLSELKVSSMFSATETSYSVSDFYKNLRTNSI